MGPFKDASALHRTLGQLKDASALYRTLKNEKKLTRHVEMYAQYKKMLVFDKVLLRFTATDIYISRGGHQLEFSTNCTRSLISDKRRGACDSVQTKHYSFRCTWYMSSSDINKNMFWTGNDAKNIFSKLLSVITDKLISNSLILKCWLPGNRKNK